MKLIIDGSLGDEIALTAVLRELKKQLPHERLTVDCRFPELIANNPWVNRGTEDNGAEIRIPLAPNYRIGNLVHAYGQYLGIMIYDSRPEVFLTPQERTQLWIPPSAVAIDTWAGWPRRRWPKESFTELVRLIRSRYPHVSIVEVGTTIEDCVGNVRDGPLPDTDLCLLDRVTVRETAAALSKCCLYIGNDSGLSHLAAAVGVDQVTIFSIDWYSIAYRNTWPVFDLQRDCSGCAETCVKQLSCLQRIEPIDVLRVVEATGRIPERGSDGAALPLTVHVITRCSRPTNLRAILASIERSAATATSVRVRWHIVYDLNHVSSPINADLVFASPRIEIIERSGRGIGPVGYNLVNQRVDEITDGVIYCLDDDNLLHPRFLSRIASAFADPNVGVVVVQQRFDSRIRFIGPDFVQQHNIDLAQFVIRSALMSGRRYPTNDYAADGAMMEDMWRTDKSRFIFIHEVLSYYNALG